MQLFTIFFSRPVEFGLATALTVVMLLILVRAMFSAQGPTGLSRFVTRPSSKFLFAALFIGWAVSPLWPSPSCPTRARTRPTAASG